MCKELGMEVVHTVAYHYDPKIDNNSDDKIAAATDVEELGMDVNTSVSDVQTLEQLITLKNNWPDIVIGRAHNITAWAAQLGLPSIETKVGLRVAGYPGLIELGERLLRQLKNTNFEKKLKERYVSPFTSTYENLSPFSLYSKGGE
jgi:nitrogenase molybdenum-iron protein alpha chain